MGANFGRRPKMDASCMQRVAAAAEAEAASPASTCFSSASFPCRFLRRITLQGAAQTTKPFPKVLETVQPPEGSVRYLRSAH